MKPMVIDKWNDRLSLRVIVVYYIKNTAPLFDISLLHHGDRKLHNNKGGAFEHHQHVSVVELHKKLKASPLVYSSREEDVIIIIICYKINAKINNKNN